MDTPASIVLGDTMTLNDSSETLLSAPIGNGGTPLSQVVQPIDQLNRSNGKGLAGQGPGRTPRVQRACNECRQQKLRCDVVADPYTICSRCRRLRLACKIDHSFKRIDKRRERNERRKLTEIGGQPNHATTHLASSPDRMTGQHMAEVEIESADESDMPLIPPLPTESTIPTFDAVANHSTTSQWSELPDPRQTPTHPEMHSPSTDRSTVIYGRTGSIDLYYRQSNRAASRRLDTVELNATTVDHLFKEFFTKYHPFLPFLDDLKSPDEYYDLSRLLFWAIIAVASRRYSGDLILFTSLSISLPRLLWSTLQSVPQSHHDVKALCLLCTWPFPINSSSYDPTFMLSGTMMALAMQIGLHRPGHVQDFSKGAVSTAQEDFQDRMKTWAACNIVCQCVATGYGQPSMTIYDWALDNVLLNPAGYHLSQELIIRLRIEKFCDRVTKALYCSLHQPTGVEEESERKDSVKILLEELSGLKSEIGFRNLSKFNRTYIGCVDMHIRLSTFFDSNTSNHYVASLTSLYEACEKFLSLVSGLEPFNQTILSFCPNYIYQITVAVGFALLRLLRSPLTEYIDVELGKSIFNSAIASVRQVSVSNNDIPGRLADVLVQLWARGNYIRHLSHGPSDFSDWQRLQLKVRTRMSSSVVWDSLLEWRKGFRADAKINHTVSAPKFSNIDGRQPRNIPTQENQSMSNLSMDLLHEFDLDEMARNDAFYPMNWLLEGVADFPNTNLSGMAPL